MEALDDRLLALDTLGSVDCDTDPVIDRLFEGDPENDDEPVEIPDVEYDSVTVPVTLGV